MRAQPSERPATPQSGLDGPHMTFLLPDGQTSNGYETYTCVQNPNPGAVTIQVSYLPQGGGKTVTFTDEIPKGSRKTYNMADKIPSGRASIIVKSLDGARPIMVERSMYWNTRGAGTNTVGAPESDKRKIGSDPILRFGRLTFGVRSFSLSRTTQSD